jgi:hypothetical protein
MIAIRSHVRKDQPAQLAHGIGQMFHPLRKLASPRFPRHLEALTVNVKQPPVVRAANAAVFDVTVFQRRTAVRAAPADQTKSPFGIAKQDEIFAEDPHGLRNIVEIARRADYKPVAPKPFARGRTRPDMGNVD